MFSASPSPAVRLRRLLTWFDALRTLRFIHLVESREGLARLPVGQAVASAPFCDFWRPDMSENTVRSAAFSAEQARPAYWRRERDLALSTIAERIASEQKWGVPLDMVLTVEQYPNMLPLCLEALAKRRSFEVNEKTR